jgi:1-phosphatidylinositol phosphodiesterase
MKPALTAGLLIVFLRCHAAAGGADWMTPLDGGLSLSRISIPGTHNSGALHEPVAGTAKCQDLTISGQLNAGIRFLDIRCRHVGNAFRIHHGAVDQKIGFADVLKATCAFLDAHPGETVIMSVKEEHEPAGNSRGFESTFDSYVARNPGKWLLSSNIPTLRQARGRIILFRRFGATDLPKGIDASKWPDNTTFSTPTLRVQDRYVVSKPGSKWAAIRQTLDEARHGGRDTLYVNFTSGYVAGLFGIPDITSVSDYINPRLGAYFTKHPRGRFGIIVMDFADAPMASRIFSTNTP